MALKIAFDLDGCLINIESVIRKLTTEIYNIEIKQFPKEIDHFDFRMATGLRNNQLWPIFRLAYKEIKTTPIFPGATELLARLYELSGEPPFILTARPFDAANETYAMVSKVAQGTPFELALKHPKADKSQYLSNYGFFVEDRRRTALELSKTEICTLLIERNYNYIEDLPKNIIYIKGVADLIPYVNDFVY